MITATAQVVAIKDDALIVRCQPQSSCAGCAASKSCGAGIINQAFTPNARDLAVASAQAYPVGTWVKIGLPAPTLLRSAALVYLLPLAGFIGVALGANLLGLSEGRMILLSALGGGGGIMLAKHLAPKLTAIPKLLEVITSNRG